MDGPSAASDVLLYLPTTAVSTKDIKGSARSDPSAGMASAMTSSSSSLPNTGRSSDDFPPDVSSRAGRKAGSRPARPLSRLRLFIWNPPSSLDDPDVLSASGSHRSKVSSLFTAGEARMLRGFCRMAVIEYERSCSLLNASRSSDSSSSSSSSSNSRDGSSSMPSMCS